MTRTRTSAKAAGTRFERSIADWLKTALGDDRIDRRVRNGAKDRGDIAGVRHRGHRVVLELKDVSRTDLSGWVKEAHLEAGNDDALVGLVIHKRRGTADPGEQYVTCTLADLVALLTGVHPAAADHVTARPIDVAGATGPVDGRQLVANDNLKEP